MGYCVDVTLENVKFKTKYIPEIINKLKEKNKSWITSNDWRRFHPNLDDILEILDDIGFSSSQKNDEINILYFDREKLGDDYGFWEIIIPYLEPDFSISYEGEDHYKWKYKRNKDGTIKETEK